MPAAPAPEDAPLAWLTIWDDAAEADDFARAAAQVPSAADGAVTVARRSEAVALFFGPRELAPAALDTMLDAWRAVDYPDDKMGPLERVPLPSRDGLRRAKPGYARRAERCSPTTRSSARLSTP